jgi:hypothetical protein
MVGQLSNQRFRSLLDELTDGTPSRDRDLFIESRAQQLVASASHLLKLINETYDEETAADLQKRLINSIRSGDENKFRRGIRSVMESKRK